MSDRIRVLVVDDQPLFRRWLEVTLEDEDGIEVVGSAADDATAVTVASKTSPDVVLVGFRIPHEGILATNAIGRALSSSTKIVLLTDSDDEAHLFEAIKAGAVRYLLKSSPVDGFTMAIRSAYNGIIFIGPSMASRIMSEFASIARDSPKQAWAPRLTSRELEVLKLLAAENTNPEIGRRLSISENTVKNHARNVLDKIQLYTRMAAM